MCVSSVPSIHRCHFTSDQFQRASRMSISFTPMVTEGPQDISRSPEIECLTSRTVGCQITSAYHGFTCATNSLVIGQPDGRQKLMVATNVNKRPKTATEFSSPSRSFPCTHYTRLIQTSTY